MSDATRVSRALSDVGLAGLFEPRAQVDPGERLLDPGLTEPTGSKRRRVRPAVGVHRIRGFAKRPATGESPVPRAGPARLLDLGPVLAAMSLGLLAIARAASLTTIAGAQPAQHPVAAQSWYIAGLVLIVLPAAIGVLLPGISRGPRIVLAVALPAFLQLSRLLLDPTITGYYPAGQSASTALTAVTGLPAHTGLAIVLVVVRVVTALAVLAVVQQITWSTRIGAVAAVIYACAPQPLLLDARFSYQAIALPLALLVVHLFLTRRSGAGTSPARSLLLPVLALAAVAVSDQPAAVVLAVAFAAWWLGEARLRRGRSNETAALAVMTCAGAAMAALGGLIPATTSGGSVQYRDAADTGLATWERGLVVTGLVITVLALVPALIRSRSWPASRTSSAVVLCVIAAGYPLIALGQLNATTAQPSLRLAGVAFVGVAFAVAWWLCRHPIGAWQAVAFAVAATLTFLGGMLLAAGPLSQQLPGPARAAGQAGGPDPAATAWIATQLPAADRTLAQRETGLLTTAGASWYAVRPLAPSRGAARLLQMHADPTGPALVRRAGIRYLIVAAQETAARRAVDSLSGVDRVYDNGSAAVYDLGDLGNVEDPANVAGADG